MSVFKKSFFGNLMASVLFILLVCASVVLVDYVFFDNALLQQDERDVRVMRMQLREQRKENKRLLEELRIMGQQVSESHKTTKALEKAANGKHEVMQLYGKLTRAMNEIQRLEKKLETPEHTFVKSLEKAIKPYAHSIKIVEGKFIFKDPIFFKSASSLLTNNAKDLLDDVAEMMKAISAKIPADNPWVLKVMGHADPRRLKHRNRYASNWILSSARAVAVVQYLVQKGVDAGRLYAAGFSSYQSMHQGKSQEDMRQSRRAVLSFDRKVNDA